ncbi:MAG: DUF2147 domain-containing protein [Chitinophagales bacterium]
MNKMKYVATIALVLAMTFSLSAQTDIIGVWKVGEDNTKVEFYQKEQGVIDGKIISSDNPKAKIGKNLVKDVQYKAGEWKGKVYSPKKKKWYDATLERKQDKLEVAISVGFFSKTMEWKNVKP